MARRFGRNQRRQLKAELRQAREGELDQRAISEGWIKSATRAEASLAEERGRFKHLVSDLVNELPENSALLTPLTQEVLTHWPPMPNRRALAGSRGGNRELVGHAVRNDLRLAERIVELVTYELQVTPDLLADRLRFHVVQDKGDGSAYCVDGQFFRLHGFSERMVQEMAEKIARDLASYFGEGRRGRG